ncbi:radical SAM protein [Desulfocurvibacter africanus]|uniref:radical SAM/SPASM domain-containing protein n=1 Tax=Desulfocurvibacter africanus TaxID=873 RepID=UPI002FDB028B
MLKIRQPVSIVFLMLGHECNLSCVYCMQAGTLRKKSKGSIPQMQGQPDKIIPFLRALAEDQKETLTVQFYGGEPLLYFATIRSVVEALEDLPNVAFSTISNGTLISPAIVDFLNEKNFHVAISWDGLNVEETRGVDVLRVNPDILDIKSLGISVVLSARAYPLDVLKPLEVHDREYALRHDGRNIGVNFDTIFDFGGLPRELLEVDLHRLSGEMCMLAAEYGKSLAGVEHNAQMARLAAKYVNQIRNTLGFCEGIQEYRRGSCACGNGYKILNLDLDGNLYRCHNTGEKVGTIDNSYGKILDTVIALDPTRDNCKVCKDCPVVTICECGCPLIGQAARQAGYCDIKRAAYLPFVEWLLRAGEVA